MELLTDIKGLELLDIIVKKLLARDLKRLRQTCHLLELLTAPLIFSRLVLNMDSGRCGLILELLQSIATGRSRVGSCIRSLEIQSLTPPQCRSFRLWRRVTKKHEELCRIVEEQLVTALPHFTAVKSLSLNFSHLDQVTISSEGAILHELASLPKLSHLYVCMHHDVDPEIRGTITQHFHGLRSLHISGGSSTYGDIPKKLIAQSPNLSSLTLDGYPSIHYEHVMSLTDVMSFVPSSVSLPLTSLTLGGASIHRFNNFSSIHKHLQLLSSLVLTGDLIDAPSSLWDGLQSSNVRLQKLVLHQCDYSVIDYLQSYSGLVHLSIDLCGFRYNDRRDDDLMAERLYERVFPKHTSSLRTIQIRVPYEGTWSLGNRQLEAILGCRKLISISIGVGPTEGDKVCYCKNVVSRLLSSIGTGILPDLRVLKLFLAYPTSARGIGDSVLLMYSNHGVYGHARLNDVVANYACVAPSPGIMRLELLTGHLQNGPCSLTKFSLVRSEMDGKWRFTGTPHGTRRQFPLTTRYNESDIPDGRDLGASL